MRRIRFPESGYTPTNLRFLLEAKKLSRQNVANILDVSVRTVDKWCLQLNSKDHRDMPLVKWCELLAKTN